MVAEQLSRIVRSRWAPELDASQLQWTASQLHGGLDGAMVERLDVAFPDRRGSEERAALVLKILPPEAAREAILYEHWLRHLPRELRPDLLAVQRCGKRWLLLLEFVPSAAEWPFRDLDTCSEVLRRLSAVHRSGASAVLHQGWDYEAELETSGRHLLSFVTSCVQGDDSFRYVGPARPAIRRLVEDLPRLRQQLLESGPFPAAPLHGDVHPGNVVVRRVRDGLAPVFIDWARARVGSPLEDVSSWLQSLGYWEPRAKQRHDTLLRHYLVARGYPDRLGSELRSAYWLAAASNILAGAALYHLCRAQQAQELEERRRAHSAAADALRILRRADACWKR